MSYLTPTTSVELDRLSRLQSFGFKRPGYRNHPMVFALPACDMLLSGDFDNPFNILYTMILPGYGSVELLNVDIAHLGAWRTTVNTVSAEAMYGYLFYRSVQVAAAGERRIEHPDYAGMPLFVSLCLGNLCGNEVGVLDGAEATGLIGMSINVLAHDDLELILPATYTVAIVPSSVTFTPGSPPWYVTVGPDGSITINPISSEDVLWELPQ